MIPISSILPQNSCQIEDSSLDSFQYYNQPKTNDFFPTINLSKISILLQLAPHEPIEIGSNEDFLNYNFTGSGEETDPYIIENLEITTDFDIVKRGKLYDYSYIMKQLDSLFFCYFFVGKSFHAIKRLDEFSNILSETSNIWNKLVTISKTDLQLNFEERRSITSFIDEIFLSGRQL
ncbi:MAG: hypothetical protein HGN29_09705 [Asgard group archaeon]|nr:hypothetical protein [Asgard group archaeon]